MPELNPQQFPYVHQTDADLKPGDVVIPAAIRGHESRYSAAPGYDPHRVYIADRTHPNYEPGHYGKHDYAVEPVGDVHPDPEVEHWKKYYSQRPEEAEDMFTDYVDKHGASGYHEQMLGPALANRTTRVARVIHRL